MDPRFTSLIDQIGTAVIGKRRQIRLAMTCLFASGHLLIEDLPGIGKTTLAKVLSSCLGLRFQRIQCTSDMLPGDILGLSVFDRESGGFTFHPGPVFSQVLLADEINRASPKTQSALLEAMEEHQVTIDGKTRHLPQPFYVIATQNPHEQSGTFPLPESQLDRFLMRISIGYPDRQAEHRLLKRPYSRGITGELSCGIAPSDVALIQRAVDQVHASDALLEYLQDIIDFTRKEPLFTVGLSPRAGLCLLQAARSWAYIDGRDHVLPDDIQQVLPWVVAHRLRSSKDYAEFPARRLSEIFTAVPIP